MKPKLETANAGNLTLAQAAIPADYTASPRSSVTHRLARGALIYVLGLAIGKGLTVVLQVMLGRWLGPASYGIYALGYSVTSLLSWVAVLGLDQGVLRYCALYRTQDQPGRVRATLRRAIGVAGVASVLVAAVLVLGSREISAWFFTQSFATVLASFALALPFLALIRIAGTYLQSLHDIYRMTVLQLLAQPVVNVALVVVAIGLGWGLEGAVGAFVLCCICTAGLATYYLVEKLPAGAVGKAAVAADHAPLIRYSLALMFVGLGYQVILRAPQVLLGHLGSSAQVGVYSAGASFALAFGFMTLTFLQPAMPMMVELYETGQADALRRLYQNATRWTLAAVMPAFLLLSLFSSEVMRLFGRNFSAAGPILLVLSLGWLAYYGKGPGSALLEMTGRQHLDLANTVGAGALTVAMNYLAIPRYGAIGAAVATAGSIAVWALVEYLEVRLLYGLSPWSPGALVDILAAVITAIVTVSLRPLVPEEILFPLAACLYGTLYFGFCLEPDDRRVIASALAWLRAWLRC